MCKQALAILYALCASGDDSILGPDTNKMLVILRSGSRTTAAFSAFLQNLGSTYKSQTDSQASYNFQSAS